ncbi:terminase small subunit [Enterobacter mori]|nr:terminase small subunit [Enterobacter mori]
MALTDKQEMFCREYLIDLNATQAPFGRSTVNNLSANLSKPDIRLRIAELKSQRNDLVVINATYLLNRLLSIDKKFHALEICRSVPIFVVKPSIVAG